MYRYLIALLVLSACGKDSSDTNPNSPPKPVSFNFSDGFESSSTEVTSIKPSDDSRWTNIQLVNSGGMVNGISLVGNPVMEGSQSLRVFAHPTVNGVESKMDVEKDGFTAYTDQTVKLSANFYIKSTANLENLFLMDLECCSCWDQDVPDNKCPGVRLQFDDSGYLEIERGKIGNETIGQSTYVFPRNEWVEVVWEMKLSSEESGMNRLIINGQEVINAATKNLPNATEFKSTFANEGIDFDLVQPILYERFQIGATANSSEGIVEMYVDDVSIEIE